MVLWSVIDWGRVRRQVEQAQCAIAEAAAKRDLAKIEELQEALVHSLLARMLAVHTVSQNRGSRTAGIDGERWTTQEELFAGVFAIETDEYRSCPLRRIYIPKGTGDELRPISIPTLDDRVVQTAGPERKRCLRLRQVLPRQAVVPGLGAGGGHQELF